MYVNDSDTGSVVVEFNVLSRSCNVSSYEFRFEVDDSLNETNCKMKLFISSGHLEERTVIIKHDERVESCGKVSIIFVYDKKVHTFLLEVTLTDNLLYLIMKFVDGNKRTERQSKGLRGLEAYFKGGQDPLRAVEPLKKNEKLMY